MWNKKSFIYATKIWFTSWLLTPLVLFIISLIFEYFSTDKSLYNVAMDDNGLIKFNMIQIYLIIYCVSFIASLPYWLLLWPTISFINKMEANPKTKKIYISIAAIILLSILFSLFNSRSFLSVVGFPWYISILFGVWYYRIELNSKPKESILNIDDHLIEY